jgi:hypothetical protein
MYPLFHQVFVRIRPPLPSEEGRPLADLSIDEPSNTISMTHIGRDYTFAVDGIFTPGASQKSVYEGAGVDGVVASVVQHGAIHVCSITTPNVMCAFCLLITESSC